MRLGSAFQANLGIMNSKNFSGMAFQPASFKYTTCIFTRMPKETLSMTLVYIIYLPKNVVDTNGSSMPKLLRE